MQAGRSYHNMKLSFGITKRGHKDSTSLGPIANKKTGAQIFPGGDGSIAAFWLNEVVATLKPFDLVGEDFVYEENLKIVLVVYNPGSEEEAFLEVGELAGINVFNTWANVVFGFIRKKIASVLGEKNDVMIYTGSISKVGQEHIEYDANSYKGCSGAIVIVMDRNHPDYGKAIAVHARLPLRLESQFRIPTSQKLRPTMGCIRDITEDA